MLLLLPDTWPCRLPYCPHAPSWHTPRLVWSCWDSHTVTLQDCYLWKKGTNSWVFFSKLLCTLGFALHLLTRDDNSGFLIRKAWWAMPAQGTHRSQVLREGCGHCAGGHCVGILMYQMLFSQKYSISGHSKQATIVTLRVRLVSLDAMCIWHKCLGHWMNPSAYANMPSLSTGQGLWWLLCPITYITWGKKSFLPLWGHWVHLILGAAGSQCVQGVVVHAFSVLLQTMASPDTDEVTEAAQETHMGGQLSCVTLDPVSPTLGHSDAALKNFCWALSNLALPIGNAPLWNMGKSVCIPGEAVPVPIQIASSVCLEWVKVVMTHGIETVLNESDSAPWATMNYILLKFREHKAGKRSSVNIMKYQ